MERKEYKIFLPSDEQAGQLIDVAWKDFYEKVEEAGHGINHDGVRSMLKDIFVSGYTYGYNDVLNIIRGQMAADELANMSIEETKAPEDDVRIVDLGFSVRVINCLKSADIETLGDLLRVSVTYLLKIHGFGKRSLDEIRAFYEKHGYKFGNESLEYNHHRIFLGRGCHYLPKKGVRV